MGRTNEKKSSLPFISLLNLHTSINTERNLPGKKLKTKDTKLANDNQQSLIKYNPCQAMCIIFHNMGVCLKSQVKKSITTSWNGLRSCLGDTVIK